MNAEAGLSEHGISQGLHPKRGGGVSKNQLGTIVFASPTICGGEVFMRVANMVGDKRQESLYCSGNLPPGDVAKPVAKTGLEPLQAGPSAVRGTPPRER